MKKIIVTSILIFQFLIMSEPVMSRMPGQLLDLHYQVKIIPPKIQVVVDIFRIKRWDQPVLTLYTGAMRMKNIEIHTNGTLNLPFQNQNALLLIDLVPHKSDKITLTYEIGLGFLAKHGHQGFANEEFCAFAGEQVFAIPTSGRAQEISVRFDFPQQWQAFLPLLPPENPIPGQITISDSTWQGIYQLMKNSYAFGNFDDKEDWVAQTQPNLAVIRKKLSSRETNRLFEIIPRFFRFFESQFEAKLDHYQLLVLPHSPQNEPIMAGIGPSSMAFTLNPDILRDWQLLAHRLFHVFFDRNIQWKALHFPPYLWFLEGLATFHESYAADLIKGTSATKSTNRFFSELYQRYLYFRLKDPELFTLIPSEEQDIIHSGQIEFLHYTQAPLIIFALHHLALRENAGPGENWLIQWLDQTKKNNNIHLEKQLSEFSGTALAPFFEKHVTGKEILNLNQFFTEDSKEDSAKVIHHLKNYEQLLGTWYQSEPDIFQRHSIEDTQFAALSDAAQKRDIHFSYPDMEAQIQKFSPTLFRLLQNHWLRLHICRISPDDAFRNARLNQPLYQQRWQMFLNRLNAE